MLHSVFSFEPEQPAHDIEIESINAEAFGPGRFARAAYRIRESGPHDRHLSFVAIDAGIVAGSVRLTSIWVGKQPALLLGPLAVRPDYKNKGAGRALVGIALDAAGQSGENAVLLVGDLPYYGPLGFVVVETGKVTLPAPVDPNRVLICCLNGSDPGSYHGIIRYRGKN